MSIYTLVRERYDDGERDIDAITQTVLTKLMASADPAAELEPLVRQFVTTELRRMVRAMERTTDISTPTKEWTNPATEARARLLAESVWVPGEGRIAWGQLTVDQHEQVISHYRIAVAGYQATIRKHQQAIEIIRAHPGAVCLDDCNHVPAAV